MHKLVDIADWHKIRDSLTSEYAKYTYVGLPGTDLDIAQIIGNLGKEVSRLSKYEVEAKRSKRWRRYNEMLATFNKNLAECEQLFLIRVMTR